MRFKELKELFEEILKNVDPHRYPGKVNIYVNPSKSVIKALYKNSMHEKYLKGDVKEDPYKDGYYDGINLRVIKDDDDNIFVADAWFMTHGIMKMILRKYGYTIDRYDCRYTYTENATLEYLGYT